MIKRKLKNKDKECYQNNQSLKEEAKVQNTDNK